MTHCKVVVRNVQQPCAPPLFRLTLHEDNFYQAAICRAGMMSDLSAILYRVPQASQLHTNPQAESVTDALLRAIRHVRRREEESPVSRITPAQAEQEVRAQWEAHVERLAGEQSNPLPSSAVCNEIAVVLTFNRHPRCLDTKLLRSGHGRRIAGAGAEVKPAWAKGAKILVAGLTCEVWQEAALDINLSAYHVVARPEDVDEVLEALRELPYSQRPWLKHGSSTMRVPNPEEHALFHKVSSSSDCSRDAHCSIEEASMPSFALWGHPGSSSSDSDAGHVSTAWLEAFKEYVSSARPIRLNIKKTFIEMPQSPMVTPRSDYTESAPEQEGSQVTSNPRIWRASI